MSTTNTLQTFLKLSPYVAGGTYPYPVVQTDWLPASLSTGTNSGTSAGFIDLLYQAQPTATTSGASITLKNGTNATITNPIGETLSFARVDAVGFYNPGTNTVTLTGTFLGSLFAAGGTASLSLPPGAQLAYCMGTSSTTGVVVNSGTSGVLTFTATGTQGTQGIQSLIAGRSV